MNDKTVEVCMVMNEYQVTCYKGGRRIHNWPTKNPLAVGLIINIWFAREYTSEELMCQFVQDII